MIKPRTTMAVLENCSKFSGKKIKARRHRRGRYFGDPSLKLWVSKHQSSFWLSCKSCNCVMMATTSELNNNNFPFTTSFLWKIRNSCLHNTTGGVGVLGKGWGRGWKGWGLAFYPRFSTTRAILGIDPEVLQSGLANFWGIACKILNEFFRPIFPAKFSVLFLQGGQPPKRNHRELWLKSEDAKGGMEKSLKSRLLTILQPLLSNRSEGGVRNTLLPKVFFFSPTWDCLRFSDMQLK